MERKKKFNFIIFEVNLFNMWYNIIIIDVNIHVNLCVFKQYTFNSYPNYQYQQLKLNKKNNIKKVKGKR